MLVITTWLQRQSLRLRGVSIYISYFNALYMYYISVHFITLRMRNKCFDVILLFINENVPEISKKIDIVNTTIFWQI